MYRVAKVPRWVPILVVLAGVWVAGEVWGPIGCGARVFDRVVVYDSVSVDPSQVNAQALVELQPVSDRRNALEDIVGAQSDFLSASVGLAGCVRAFAEDAGDTSVTAAFVFRAADSVGPHEAYLYGTFYYRRYRDHAESGTGFEPVRVRVDPRGGSRSVVTWMEVRPVDIGSASNTGQPVDGPYPRWVDEAFSGSEQDMQRLLGPG